MFKLKTFNKGNNQAFTLVELLVAISIMAVLMALLMPNFMSARERARDAQKIQDLGAMKSALRIYYNDKQAYPTGAGGSLDNTFSGYMTNAANLGYTYGYYQTDSGDGFVTCVGLESGQGNDDLESQAKCGVQSLGFGVCGLGAGATGDKVYTVCAK